MIDPTIVRGTSDHLASLRALESEARASLVEQRGGVRWLEEHGPHDWAQVLDDGSEGHDVSHDVFVAVVDDVPVGYLVLERVSADVIRVEQVYVTPEAREVGFGDELLAAALEAGRAAGARWFEGEALPGDRDTKNLYERAGITARSITVATRLVDDPPSPADPA